MYNCDLISFNSPEKKSNDDNASTGSPGSNPFDTLSKPVTNSASEPQFIDNLNLDLDYFTKCGDISGKESLGILKLDLLNTSFDCDDNLIVPRDVFLTHSNNPLNAAFLQPPSQNGFSCGSTISFSSGSRFNSGSLDVSEPSKIYSVNFEQTRSILNEAFLNSNSKIKLSSVSTSKPTVEFAGDVKALHLNELHKRISLPEFKEEHSEHELVFSKEDETDDDFDDSVFIEAKQFASQLADGSILLYEKSCHEISIECTSPPKFFESEDEDDVKEVKVESVFKKIDKLLPPDQTFNINIPETNNIDSCKISEVKQNLSNILNNPQKCRHRSSSSGSSHDANEILHNLSAIINNEHRDAKQEECQQLLFSLADILCTNKTKNLSESRCDDNLDDSGHSSIDQEEQQNAQDVDACYEILDLRVGSRSNDNVRAIDLSMKIKMENTKRLSQSFTLPAPAKLFNSIKSQSSSASSISSLTSGTSKNDSSKLKPKKIENKSQTVKKGPLKAVLPVIDMSKHKSLGKKITSFSTTPPSRSSLFKINKTSTPINEPQLKPVAQSTPGIAQANVVQNKPNSCSSQLKNRKFYCPVSPLTRQNSLGNTSNVSSTKSSQSTSTPNLSNQSGNSKRDSLIPSPISIYRRHSATDLKTTEAKTTLKRSYSIGANKKQTVVDKLKQTVSSITNKPTKNANGTVSYVQKNVLNESNHGIVKNMKSLNLLGKLKKNKADKENCQKK